MLMWDSAGTPTAKYTITAVKTPWSAWMKTPVSPVHGVPHPHPTVPSRIPVGPAALAPAPLPERP